MAPSKQEAAQIVAHRENIHLKMMRLVQLYLKDQFLSQELSRQGKAETLQ